MWRTRVLSHEGTRYGLYGLFATSGLWALGQAVLCFDPPLAVARVSNRIGLVAGLATVGAWLYFCSAHTGQTVTDPPPLQFGTIVRKAYATTTADVALTVEGDGKVRADGTRLCELVRNAAQLAAKTGASELRGRSGAWRSG